MNIIIAFQILHEFWAWGISNANQLYNCEVLISHDWCLKRFLCKRFSGTKVRQLSCITRSELIGKFLCRTECNTRSFLSLALILLSYFILCACMYITLTRNTLTSLLFNSSHTMHKSMADSTSVWYPYLQ